MYVFESRVNVEVSLLNLAEERVGDVHPELGLSGYVNLCKVKLLNVSVCLLDDGVLFYCFHKITKPLSPCDVCTSIEEDKLILLALIHKDVNIISEL